MPPSPESLIVIGGGRWARVLTAVAGELVAPRTSITMHTTHGVDDLRSWAAQRPGPDVEVVSQWPPRAVAGAAVLVANAAADHERAARWALDADLPVLVEKPLTLDAGASRSLALLAQQRDGKLAAGHVLLFARHVENFARQVQASGELRSLQVEWTDAAGEARAGEIKQYDASVPVFADVLPHVVSIVSCLSNAPAHLERVTVREGGALVVLQILFGSVPCEVKLQRGAPLRTRRVEARTSRAGVTLDFSSEPGTLAVDGQVESADPDWTSQPRPVARMLSQFLQWSTGGAGDGRLDPAVAVRANELIDAVRGPYHDAFAAGLATMLATVGGAPSAALRYALTETLVRGGRLPADELERSIRAVIAARDRLDEAHCRALVTAADPRAHLASIGICGLVALGDGS